MFCEAILTKYLRTDMCIGDKTESVITYLVVVFLLSQGFVFRSYFRLNLSVNRTLDKVCDGVRGDQLRHFRKSYF